ncbi:MAG: hypothetical protein JWM24_570 [Solirubrobacterales bacterium]|nr:hypothetical protein [Solirubrobacterales bacterium]
MPLLAIIVAGLAIAGSTAESNVAPCDKAIIGHGSPDWRSEAVVAGPVGVRQHPLSAMSSNRNGFVTKMPLLVEGREPETVTVSVPPGLRNRVFLYYGLILGRDGQPTSTFAEARGYGEVEFQLCGNKPRTIWPGGIRVKGRAPVQLLVSVEGRPDAIPLRLGRPQAYEPR